jgi:aldose 1-epimerase
MSTMTASSVRKRAFGHTREGGLVSRFVLESAGGLVATVLDYGGIIQSLAVPGIDGRLTDVVLGYDSLADYEADEFYLGSLVGRCAGRIRRGELPIDGVMHRLPTNDGTHHLHGGRRGFGKVIWEASTLRDGDRVGVVLRHTSPDGDEGYPGTLQVQVTYAVSPDNVLSIDYRAHCDRPTAVNLTQHSYFNLAGSGDVLGHELQVEADAFTPLDSTLVPTGEIAPVAGTPLDFRVPRAIGERIDEPHEQLSITGGYDQTLVLRGWDGSLRRVARLSDPESGRALEVHTTEPGMQLYTGNFLDGCRRGKNGHRYPRHSGVCLETQHFPDSPNHPAFPSTLLRPGAVLRSRTEYRFSSER